MICSLPAESLPPWFEAGPPNVFGLPPRDPNDDDDEQEDEEEDDEEREPPVVREPDPED